MNPDEIKALVAGGEGYQAEWKERIPSKVRDITEELCGFANAAGGTFLIGVDDNNIIVGGTYSNEKRSSIQSSIREINPHIEVSMQVVEVDGKEVMVLEVLSGKQKPYVYSGVIYVRQGPNTQKLTTAEEMRDFFQQSDRIFFDEIPVSEFIPATDLDLDFFKLFRLESGFSSAINDDQIIRNLRLQDVANNFKIGAVLFFARMPEQFVEKAVIRCVAFDGYDKRIIVDNKDFTGPLHSQYTQTLQWLKNKLDVRFDIEGEGSGPRKEIWEIPETVFKEAIINALSHRDYYDKGARITVELFRDRVEISNPGGLISGISKSEFGKRSLSRNPLIFGLFEKMDLVEQVGSGVIRMRDLMEEAGLPEPSFVLEGMFTVTLLRPVDFETWINVWKERLTANRIKILELIYQNNRVTKEEMSAVVGIGSTAIDNNITWLKNKELLTRVGSDKSGKWNLTFKR